MVQSKMVGMARDSFVAQYICFGCLHKRAEVASGATIPAINDTRKP